MRRGRTVTKQRLVNGMRRYAETGANVRVLVVDDQDLFRAGLRALLERGGFHVVEDVRPGDTAFDVALRAVPDVVLLALDGTGADEAMARIREAAPGAKIIAVADTTDPHEMLDALVSGACGYLVKDDSIETIAAGIIRAADAGDPLLSDRTTRVLIDRLRELSAERRSGEALRARLSPREREVLALIAEGHDNGQIARLLFISPHTVKHHVRTICEKLGAHNRVEAAVRAARAGLV
jgi:DNA-binding NarL/FixJ family response regulator